MAEVSWTHIKMVKAAPLNNSRKGALVRSGYWLGYEGTIWIVLAASIFKPGLMETSGKIIMENWVVIPECTSGFVVLLVMPSIFARLFTRKCSSAALNGVGTWESSKGSSSASLDAFLTIWLGCPSLDLCYFRF